MKFLALACVTLIPCAFAGSINFEVGAPCEFHSTNALTTTYSGQGVTFSGSGGNNGGAILDQCGDFGISANSGTDFLAFNTGATLSDGGTPDGPETITFSSPVSNVSLYVGGADTAPGYTLLAYDASDNEIGNTSGTPGSEQWLQLSLNVSNISSVVLSFTSDTAVVDDLGWDGSVSGVPEPSSALLLAMGTAGLCALRSRARRRGTR